MRIAVGGFLHETNSFAPVKAGYDAFAIPGGWPGLTRGEALFAAVAGLNLVIAGAIETLAARGHDLVPLSWCQAVPSGPVTEDAYERITGLLIDDLKAAGPLDAVCLDLHGAMIAEHVDDGEGELLSRVRAAVGGIPIVAGLDLHANVTRRMIDIADGLVAYRTYPHVDMAATGARLARFLDRLLAGKGGAERAFRQAAFLIPLPWQSTIMAPAEGLYRDLAALETEDSMCLSFAPGFPPADIADCGPSLFGYGDDAAAVDRAVAALADAVAAHELEFAGRLWSVADGVAHALDRAGRGRGPVILADTQDNPGGGATSDTTAILEELVRRDAGDAVLGLLCDPVAAGAATAAGEGAEIAVALGGKSGLPGERPFAVRARVDALGDGVFTGTGPFYKGAHMRLGPMALLRIGGVRVVVASRVLQAADQAMFRHLGVTPAETEILVLKSSVHFRADFAAIAEDILVVAGPGPNIADPAELPYRKLRPGVRLNPGGPVSGA